MQGFSRFIRSLRFQRHRSRHSGGILPLLVCEPMKWEFHVDFSSRIVAESCWTYLILVRENAAKEFMLDQSEHSFIHRGEDSG